jgi:hypothetical protein
MIRDGHSGLPLRDIPGFHSFSLHLYLFSDGLFVTAAPSGMGQGGHGDPPLLGARLLSVDGRPAEEIYEAVRPVVSMDNEMGLKAAAPLLIRLPEVLHALGVIRSLDRATWVPLYLKSPDDAFWFEYLQDRRTIYVQCNSVRDKADGTLEQFYGRVFAFVREHAVEKMVLDIRNNGGGNNLLNRSLIHQLVCCDKVNTPGRLFTIIGRRTFSAAMNLANDLEKHTNTVFVGEPTGSSPNSLKGTLTSGMRRSANCPTAA